MKRFMNGLLSAALVTGVVAGQSAVFAGTIGVTLFGLLFTPVFYVLCRGFARDTRAARAGRSNGNA